MTARNRTLNKPYRRAVTLVAVLAAGACGPGGPPEDQAAPTSTQEATAPVALTLKAIMQGLETDMADAAHGLWIDDRATVGMAAGRIADHPHVMPEQMSIIQATLGEEFADVARQDGVVHDAALALAKAAAGPGATDLLVGYSRIQEDASPVTIRSVPASPKR